MSEPDATSSEALWESAEPTAAGYREASPTTVEPYVGKVRVIDVREPDEFVGELGHVPGAQLVPLGTVEAAAANEGWPKDETLVLVCRSGGRSGRASAALAQRGYTHVVNLAGGMLAWNAAKLPTNR